MVVRKQHRSVEALGELEGGDRELPGLVAVGGLQQRDPGELGVVAVVLLVLRAVHARVVGRDDHQAGLHPDVRRGEERVGGHVQAHVLHAHQGPAAGHRGADAHFHGHLLVGRPLAVDVLVVGQSLEDLGAGRARIGRGQLDAGLPRSAGDRLVAGEDLHRFSRRQSCSAMSPPPRTGGCGRAGGPHTIPSDREPAPRPGTTRARSAGTSCRSRTPSRGWASRAR